MPHKGQSRQPTAKSEQARTLWGSYGQRNDPTLTDWDPKTEPLIAALLEVLASGATVVLRPGSGGRSVGVAIWEGDQRHPPKWCYDADELDQWAEWVQTQLTGERAAD